MKSAKIHTKTAQSLLSEALTKIAQAYINKAGEILDMMEADPALIDALGRLDAEFLDDVRDIDISEIFNDWPTVLHFVKKCEDMDPDDLIKLLDKVEIVEAANELPDVAVVEVRSLDDMMKLEEYVNRELSYYNLGETQFIKL